jgi:hypothetical protein
MIIKTWYKMWISLIVASSVVLFPDVSSDKTEVTLPFSLAKVPIDDFVFAGHLILLVLFLSYCQAYAAAHRASEAGSKVIAVIERNPNHSIAGVRPRMYYDLLRVPNFLGLHP